MSPVEFVIGIVDKASNKLTDIAASFTKTKSSAENLAMSITDLKAKGETLRIARDASKSTSEIAQLNKEIAETDRQIERLSGTSAKVQKSTAQLSGIGSVIAGAFAVSEIKSFGESVIEVTGKFQRYEAVLTNTFGSAQKAKESMQMLTDFAAKTPFQIDELTDSYIKMVNRGITPTMDQMTKLGDLASSVGKPFDQLVEAILDAQTMEFERLKEFGVQAKKHGDMISFTFKGQTTEVKATDKAISAYMYSLGNLKGVSGSMAAISKTLEGQISNMKDSADQAKKAIGDRLAPAISWVVSKMQDFWTWAQKNADTIILITGLIGGLAIAYGIWTAAQWALNIAMMANPVGLVVAAIIALAAAIGYVILKTQGWEAAWKGFTDSFYAQFDVVKYGFLLSVGQIEIAWLSMVYKLEKAWAEFKGMLGMDNKQALADANAAGYNLLNALKEQQSNSALGKAALDKMNNKWWENLKKDDRSIIDIIGEKVGGVGNNIAESTGAAAANTTTGAATANATTAAASTSAASSVASGGTRNTQVTINVGKLVETIAFNGTVQENVDSLTAQVRDALIRVLYTVETA